MEGNFDYDLLRDDLISYFGTAMYYNPLAQMDLIIVGSCSDNELINVAARNNFDLRRYERNDYEKKIK